MMTPRRHAIFGVFVDDVTMAEADQRLREMLTLRTRNIVAYANAETLLRSARDESFRAFLRQADFVFPDGIGLKICGRWIGAPFQERIAGTDLCMALCAHAERLQKSIFLLGGRKDVAEKARHALKKRFPSLALVGYRDGFDGLSGWRDDAALCQADIVLVGLGSPKQEAWICENAHGLSNARIIMAVGGAFDMFAGNLPRAPRIMRAAGLEWLWRLALEPNKRSLRVVSAIIIFPLKVLWEYRKKQ